MILSHFSIALLLLGSPHSSLVCAANPITQAKRQADSSDPIPAIRQRFTAINRNLKRYKLIKKSLSGFSAEGGELVAYRDGQAIVKIVANYYGETGRTVEEYYYADGKLIFAFRKESTYDRPLSGKIVSTKENRFYFQDLKLIKWINEDGKEVPSTDSEFSSQQKDYLDTSQLFLKGARSKASTIEAP